MRSVRLLPGVVQDVEEAVGWYNEQGHAGLGDRFTSAFYGGVLHIQQNGEIYRKVYEDFRKILVRPFPYAVYYRLHEDIWIVTLVIHATRHPDLARDLLRERA